MQPFTARILLLLCVCCLCCAALFAALPFSILSSRRGSSLKNQVQTAAPIKASSSGRRRNSSSGSSGSGSARAVARRPARGPGAEATARSRGASVTTSPPPAPQPSSALMPVANVLRRQRHRDPAVFHIADISTQDRFVDAPLNEQLYCELALLHSRQCQRTASATECIQSVGASRLERVLPIRCSNFSYFQSFIKNQTREFAVSNSSSRDWIISAGVIPDSHRMPHPEAAFHSSSSSTTNASSSSSSSTRQLRLPVYQPGASYIPPSQRPFPNIHHKRHYSRINCSFAYRLPMSVPEEEIVESVTRDKIFDWNPVVPPRFGGHSPFHYKFGRHDEAVAAELLHRSYFAWTHHRGGWAAQRHLELLAAGTVPVFINLDSCPYDTEKYCLPGLPVDLLREAAFTLEGIRHIFLPDGWSRPPLRGVSHYFDNAFDFPATTKIVNPRRPGDIDWKKFNETAYFRLADELLRYTKRHLTTKAVAAYFLKIMGVEEPNGYVFVTARYFIWDALGLMHGLAALGIKVLSPEAHNARKMAWSATERDISKERHWHFWKGHRGAGFSFGLRSFHDNVWQCVANVSQQPLQHGEKHCGPLIEAGEVDLFAYSISVGGADYTSAEAPYYEQYLKPPLSAIKPGRIAFIDGTDNGGGLQMNMPMGDACARGHKVFVRDAPDPPDADSPWLPLWT